METLFDKALVVPAQRGADTSAGSHSRVGPSREWGAGGSSQTQGQVPGLTSQVASSPLGVCHPRPHPPPHTLPPGTWECGPTAAAAGDLPGHAEGTAPPAPAGHLRVVARGGRALPVPDPLGRTVPPSSPNSPGCSLAGLPTGLRDAAEAAGTAQLAGGRGRPRPATSCSWPPPGGQQEAGEDKAPQRDRPWRSASRGFEPTAPPLYRLLKRRATQRPCRPAPVPQFPPGRLARRRADVQCVSLRGRGRGISGRWRWGGGVWPAGNSWSPFGGGRLHSWQFAAGRNARAAGEEGRPAGRLCATPAPEPSGTGPSWARGPGIQTSPPASNAPLGT